MVKHAAYGLDRWISQPLSPYIPAPPYTERIRPLPRPYRALAAASSLFLASSGIILAVATGAGAATCGAHKVTSIPGAKAEYRLACQNGNLRVYGWVKDTRADGDFAALHVHSSSGEVRSAFANGWGEVEHFNFTFARARSAEVRLSLDN